jgi:dTDP-4-dehydrorhamnose reductase
MSQYKYKYEKYKTLYLELKSPHQNMIQISKYNNITGGGPNDSPKPPPVVTSQVLPPIPPIPPIPPPSLVPDLLDTIVQSINASETQHIYVILTGGTGTVGKAIIKYFKYKKIILILLQRRGIQINDFTLDIISNVEGFKSHSNTKKLLENCEEIIKSIKHHDSNAKFFIINSAADKDPPAVQQSMKNGGYKDINYHWSIFFTDELVKFAKKLDIPLIHYSTVYVHKGNAPDAGGWGIERKYIDRNSKPNFGDNYVYGYVKALTEDIILDNYSKSFVLRLPGIIDADSTNFTNAEDLKNTSPSKVIDQLLDKKKESFEMDVWQHKYPITAQTVAVFTFDIIEKIKDINIIVGGIINLGGIVQMTKYALAKYINKKYKLNKNIAQLKSETPSLPQSEKMIMDNSNLPKCLEGLDYAKYELYNPYETITNACDQLIKKLINTDNSGA